MGTYFTHKTIIIAGDARLSDDLIIQARPLSRQRKAAIRKLADELNMEGQVSAPTPFHETTHVTDSHHYLGTSISNQSGMTSTYEEASEHFPLTLNLGQRSSKCCGQCRYFELTLFKTPVFNNFIDPCKTLWVFLLADRYSMKTTLNKQYVGFLECT